MANAPWRCSECGTINEPVANACRTCGRWPSLFDLEASAVEEVEAEHVESDEARKPQVEVEEPPTFETQTFETETFDSRGFERPAAETFEPDPELAADADAEPESESTRRRRRLASFLVPLAFVVYLAISIIFGER
jgi:hypothetical protein